MIYQIEPCVPTFLFLISQDFCNTVGMGLRDVKASMDTDFVEKLAVTPKQPTAWLLALLNGMEIEGQAFQATPTMESVWILM